MRTLVNKRDIEKVRRLDFCYVCGERFAADRPRTRDHVPPKNAFAVIDRALNPLILAAHRPCNNDNSPVDKVMGQLVSIRHEQARSRRELKKHQGVLFDHRTRKSYDVLGAIDLKREIWRWIRGFHAALYHDYLADDTQRAIQEPLPAMAPDEHGEYKPIPVLEQYIAIAGIIKQNRVGGRLDRISAYGGKMRYECCWPIFDNGRPFCAFALDVYVWKKLGDDAMGPQRGCVGSYWGDFGPPGDAAIATSIDIPIPNFDPLDPFGK